MDGFELYDEIKKIDNKSKVCFLTASEMYVHTLIERPPKEYINDEERKMWVEKFMLNENYVPSLVGGKLKTTYRMSNNDNSTI